MKRRDYDILVMQEVRLGCSVTGTGKRAIQRALSAGWTMIMGKPMGTLKKRNATQGKYKQWNRITEAQVKQGGVATIARGLGLVRVGREGHAARMLYDTGRWQRVAVPITNGRKRDYLNISNLHANPGGTAEDRERKERLIRWTLQDADTLGNRPTVICMDANCDV